MKKTRCYLDRRRNCFYPELAKTCESNVMLCTSMKPILGEIWEVIHFYKKRINKKMDVTKFRDPKDLM